MFGKERRNSPSSFKRRSDFSHPPALSGFNEKGHWDVTPLHKVTFSSLDSQQQSLFISYLTILQTGQIHPPEIFILPDLCLATNKISNII